MGNDLKIRLRADFNGLFQGGTILCLSHTDTCPDENGNQVSLQAGMVVTAYEENVENGIRDDLVASGVVEPSPSWLQCRGSRWILRIDEDGVRLQSKLGSTDSRLK
ncbi:MAG TPA: hypothetical protein VMP01_03910 [Pirellulaceae bacterium]|nr:hypothetical protein [Pirellulaceae bacterium]